MRNLQDGVVAASDPRQIGDWTILARLGAGGMGVVYLAERNGTRAAIKTIRADLEVDPTFRKRFEREAATVAKTHSDRIARVIEANLDASPAYIAFEYYDGPNLREVVKQGGALDASALQALAIGLAEGLETIHTEGVVHRDIKPSNVIMTVRGPVIIDFGIAAYEASELTQLTTTGEPIGSPTWMSPEYITTGRAAEPGDVFGWAATIQFAATGQPPFGMGATQPLLYRITNVEPTPHGIAGPLGHLVTQALSKRPENRPSTAEILDRLLPGNAQTGSTPQLRLPLPMPITEGHQMNIGTAPVPVRRMADTISVPPPPRPRPPARNRRRGLGWWIAAICAGLVLLPFVALVAGLTLLRSGNTFETAEPVPVQIDGPFLVPPPVPFGVPPVGPVPDVTPTEPLVPTGMATQTYSQNQRDQIVLQQHVELVQIAFDDQGRPLAEPADIAPRINEQAGRYMSDQTPLLVFTEADIAGLDRVAIMDRRLSLDAIRFYPDLIEVAVNAATGQSPAGTTARSAESTLRVMVEGAMAQNGLDGLGAAAPAIEALELDLDTLSEVGHTELSDPDVQAAFGRFVRYVTDLIAIPRR